MPRKCIVPGCTTSRHFYEHGVRFFSFPPAEYVEERERWRELVGRGPEWRIPKLSCVCQRHFREEELPDERKLPVGVRPSLNLPGDLEEEKDEPEPEEEKDEPEPEENRPRSERVVGIEIVPEGVDLGDDLIECLFCGKREELSEELTVEVLRRSGNVRDEIWELCLTDDDEERGCLCPDCWHKLEEFESFVELCQRRKEELEVVEEFLEEEPEPEQVLDTEEQVLDAEKQNQQGAEEVDDLPPLEGLTVEEMIEVLEKIPPKTIKNTTVEVDNDCWDCGESFPNANQKKEHRKNCKLIGTPDSLRHQGFECEICYKRLNTRAGYRNHLVKLHSETLKSPNENCPKDLLRLQTRKRIRCPLCESHFHQLHMLKYHLRTHLVKQQNNTGGPSKIRVKDRARTCEICGKTFSYPPYLEKHMKFHLKERDFSCDLCDKAFFLKQDLQNHKSAVHLKQTHLCPICGKSYATKKRLDRHHRAIHEPPREDLKCLHCAKQMTCPVALRYHVMIHTGEKNHRCETCDRAFRMRYELNQHRIRVHQEQIEGVRLYKQQQQQQQREGRVKAREVMEVEENDQDELEVE